jgi:hypothetical protein
MIDAYFKKQEDAFAISHLRLQRTEQFIEINVDI